MIPGLTGIPENPFRPKADLSKFWVIAVISNPQRFKRRYELYWKFAHLVSATGVKMITVEQAFGDRPFMVTQAGNPYHLQIRTVEELWHKENMINLGVRHATSNFPGQVREVAWVDADCFPMVPMIEWFEETWHALQHYEFVQMWKWLLNFGPQGEVIGEPQPGFMASYEEMDFDTSRPAAAAAYKGTKPTAVVDTIGETTYPKHHHHHRHHHHRAQLAPPKPTPPKQLGRPGLAWAANLSAFRAVGGLVDFCILGSGDWHMAHALIGAMTEQTTLVGTLRGHGSQEYALAPYTEALLEWQRKCERWIKRDVGYVNVTVGHWWHGKYKDRKYGSRGVILIENQYNPYTDVKPDENGLLQLETWDDRQIRLRDQVRMYFKTRNEDSIDF